jgi:hypothetical protein
MVCYYIRLIKKIRAKNTVRYIECQKILTFERVVIKPKAYQGMQRNINQIANAFRPTLGSVSPDIAITKLRSHVTLDRGGLITQSKQQIPDRNEDVGDILAIPNARISVIAISLSCVRTTASFFRRWVNALFADPTAVLPGRPGF